MGDASVHQLRLMRSHWPDQVFRDEFLNGGARQAPVDFQALYEDARRY